MAAGRRRRVPAWVEVLGALLLAIVAFNAHISTSGDALSSLDRGDRRIVYASVLVAAAALLAASVLRDRPGGRRPSVYFAAAALASTAAMLLDVQDGPAISN